MMNSEQIRNDQRAEGHRREGTLSPRQPFRASDKGQGAPRKPFVAKGHDAVLQRIQQRENSTISITPISTGEPVLGKLVARDKYTITIQLECGTRRTFYKHAIESFDELVTA